MTVNSREGNIVGNRYTVRNGLWLSGVVVALLLSLLFGAPSSSSSAAGAFTAGTWAPTGSMAGPRTGACAAQLHDGRVVVVGGDGSGVLSSVEAYDQSGHFSEVASLSTGRSQHACAVLDDGRVLVLGGVDPNEIALSTAEIYDPNSDTWSVLPQGMGQARFNHTATLLADGRVLIAGGEDFAGVSDRLELFDPASGGITPMTAALSSPRTAHGATRLADGRVLITGGGDGTHVLATAEIVDPTTAVVSPAPDMSSPRAGHTSTRLLDDRILIAGGNDGQTDLASAELYAPDASIGYPSLGSLAAPRRFHMAFLLPANNSVLIVGGTSGTDELSTAELYAAWTDTFTTTGSMASPRMGAAGSAAPFYGMMLVAGGGGQSSAELYDYATLETDRIDYAPGDQVIVTGSGWESGETVELVFYEDPTTHPLDIFYSTADAAGYFENTEYSPDPHDLGVHYLLVAIGTHSQAQTRFTDAAQPTATTLTTTIPNPSSFGQTGNLVATVTRIGGGSTPTCGTVTFKNNGALYAVVTLTTSNIATTSAASLPMGNDALVAEFAPAASGCNYSVSTSNTINQVVGGGNIVVTPDNASRTYGSANPVFTGTLTGVAPGDNITATYDSAATSASPVGGYSIVPTLVDPDGKLGNYTVTINNGTLTVSAAALSVTGADATRAYGDANPGFSGTLTGVVNGDNITATYDSPATPASPVGGYAIIPTLVDPGTKLGNYTVTSNNGALTVSAAALSVTGDDATRAYGDANPVFSGTLTGVVNGDNITATYDSAATPASPVGSYAIVPTLVDPGTKLGNYTVTINNGSLTIGPVALSVTADDSSRAYGSANPAFSGTLTGLLNGDNITATYDSAATPASPVGSYAIAPTLVDPDTKLGNYTVTINDGTLTVGAAALNVTGADATRTYGDANPGFSGTLTGVAPGDNITATYDSAATPASPVGGYSIVPTLVDPDGKLGNYTVTINNGTLTVGAAALSVTGADATRAYGDANPAFSGTLTGVVNGDNITATYDSAATPASPVGGYPIVPTLVDPDTKLGNYAVTINNGTLTLSAVALSVTANSSSRAYGAANPAFSGTLTGLLNGDNITATYDSPATPASPVGTYAIVPTLVDPDTKLGNYAVTINNGTLTVSAVALSVTADNQSRAYGVANPVFTGSIAGVQNGDNITATYASAANLSSPAGAYSIVPTLVDPGAKLGNYTVTINNGTLTVGAATLFITSNNTSRTYGAANPVFTGTITGLINGDIITATYSSSATPVSPVGTYSVVPTAIDPGNKLGNYTVVISNGTLSVGPAPLAVTATCDWRLYGSSNPAFTGTVAGLMNGDNITATYSSPATLTSAVGSYGIVPSLVDPGNKVGNYTVTMNDGTLTVTPTALVVIANNTSRAYGFTNPAFTGLLLGVRNGDNIAATYASAATVVSPAGSYSIVPTLTDPGNKLGNYTVITVNGTLTVTVQPLAITQPLNAQVLSCASGATPPTVNWLPAQYDKYKVIVGLDAGFLKRVSSGNSWLRTASWNVPLKKWNSICSASTGTVYLRVQGVDLNALKKDPTRRLTGPTTVSATQ